MRAASRTAWVCIVLAAGCATEQSDWSASPSVPTLADGSSGESDAAASVAGAPPPAPSPIPVRADPAPGMLHACGHRFCIDGEPFDVRGINYAPARAAHLTSVGEHWLEPDRYVPVHG